MMSKRLPTEVQRALGFDKWLVENRGYDRITSSPPVMRRHTLYGKPREWFNTKVEDKQRHFPSTRSPAGQSAIGLNEGFLEVETLQFDNMYRQQMNSAPTSPGKLKQLTWCERNCLVGHSKYCKFSGENQEEDKHRPLNQEGPDPKPSTLFDKSPGKSPNKDKSPSKSPNSLSPRREEQRMCKSDNVLRPHHSKSSNWPGSIFTFDRPIGCSFA